MKRASAATLALAVALIGCALAFARLVASPGPRGVEVGRAHVARVDPALAARLARGDLDLLVQWFGPAADERPSGYDGVEERVRSAFDALERAAPGRVRTQILRPASDEDARRHAEALGLAPFRERRVVRDGWTDSTVWSALRTVVAGRGASVVRALTPSLADGTQALIAAGIAEIEAPRRPRVALSAPGGHTRLRALLRELADVSEIDFDADADLPRDVDLLCWIAPARAEPEHAARLRAFVERGGSALVAASRFSARVDGEELVTEAAGPALDAVYAEFGVAADARPLLEAPPPEAIASGTTWTWHVARAIGARQDFRAFGSQPNGTLGFQAPAALQPDVERLRRAGASFTSLATSSERCFVLADDTERVAVVELARGSTGTAEPPRALLARIAPDDPTHGSLVFSASASPFGDLGLADPNYVHEELVRVLVRGLASSERRALATVARARPEPLPPATHAERWTVRALCIALVPLALFAIGLARGAISLRDFAGRSIAAGALALAGTAVVGLAASAIGARVGLDASRDGAHGLAPELASIAAAAGGATITTAFSDASALPPELRPHARELASRCDRLARATPGLEHRTVDPDAGDAAGALAIARLERTRELGDVRTTTSFHASVVVAKGDRRRVLDFPDTAAFEHADFRLALALRDVTTGARTVISFRSEPARVTPSEALEHYQKKKLFAPGTGDPFAAARALLARNGFEVRDAAGARRANATAETEPALVVWMQPRRDATFAMQDFAARVASGVPGLLCAQQHRIRPRARADRAHEAALWPEPQFPDVDRVWLPALGVVLAPELVFDAENGVLRTAGTSERDGRIEAVSMDLANPLVVRSTPAGRAASALTAGVGDLLMPSPARIVLDEAELARRGLVATPILATSARAWTETWTGGDLARSAFTPNAATTGRQTLGVVVEGAFPGADADAAPSTGTGARTRLAILGASEPFTDAYLETPEADHARLLLQSCAALALPPEFAALLARRASVGGYRVLEPGQRAAARAITLAAGPALVLLLAFGWRTWRGRRAVTA